MLVAKSTSWRQLFERKKENSEVGRDREVVLRLYAGSIFLSGRVLGLDGVRTEPPEGGSQVKRKLSIDDCGEFCLILRGKLIPVLDHSRTYSDRGYVFRCVSEISSKSGDTDCN